MFVYERNLRELGSRCSVRGTVSTKVPVKQHVWVRTEGTAVVLLRGKLPTAHCRVTAKQSESKRDLVPLPAGRPWPNLL